MNIKRLRLIIFIIFISVYVLLIISAFTNIDRVVQTSASASVGRKLIVVDAGHGGDDGGAAVNGIVEKNINLSISKKLAEVLRVNGYDVIETRDKDEMINSEGTSLRERKVSDMKKRLEIFNKDNCIVISIHQNKFDIEKYCGTQVFYGSVNPESKNLAESIQRAFVETLQPENKRECKKADGSIFLLSKCVNPSVIVECGFISNNNEAKLLSNEKYQNKIAFTIFIGLTNYINAIPNN